MKLLRGRFRLILILVVLLGMIIGFAIKHFANDKVVPVMPINVSVMPAQIQTIPLQAKALGPLLAPETVTLQAKIAGAVTKIAVKNGQYVRQGQLIMQLDDSSEQAIFEQDNAAYLAAQSQLESYEELNKIQPGVISKIQYEQVVAAYKEAQGKMQAAQTNLNYTQITAPFSGVLGETNLAVGSYVTVGENIIDLVNKNNLEVKYALPESDYNLVHLGQTVSLTTDALPGQTFTGSIDFIAPLIDSTSNAFNVRAEVQNKNNLLAPGMLMHVTHMLDPNRQVMAVPSNAIIPDMSGYSVFVVRNNQAEQVFVKIGQQFDNYIAITSGLQPGDLVIVQGQQNVESGTPVKVVASSS